MSTELLSTHLEHGGIYACSLRRVDIRQAGLPYELVPYRHEYQGLALLCQLSCTRQSGTRRCQVSNQLPDLSCLSFGAEKHDREVCLAYRLRRSAARAPGQLSSGQPSTRSHSPCSWLSCSLRRGPGCEHTWFLPAAPTRRTVLASHRQDISSTCSTPRLPPRHTDRYSKKVGAVRF
jgi:hypothetical protein